MKNKSTTGYEDLDEKTKHEFFKYHTHAEIVYDENPDQIIYREDDVIELVQTIAKKQSIEFAKWLRKNYNVKSVDYWTAKVGNIDILQTENELYKIYIESK